MDDAKLKRFIDPFWEEQILPTLTDYIGIPNKSPAFDPDWEKRGHMRDAVALFEGWARAKIAALPGAKLEVVELAGRTPLIFIDVPGESRGTALLYGHLDKQPEFSGWLDGLGPWKPVRRGERLYGRGGADDGYAMFSALCALLALKEQKIPHARAVILIEACEESGSYDLPHYVDHLAARLGKPSLVVCLDSGCGDYDRLWVTTSLRGIAAGTLTVRVLTEGVHSGDASGVAPSSFLILRKLLSRLEDEATGRIAREEFFARIPDPRIGQAKRAADALGDGVYARFPWAGSTQPTTTDLKELVLNRTWRPALSIIGIDGLPAAAEAGNVAVPFVAAKISLRLPPPVDGEKATAALKKMFEFDPPFGAEIEFAPEQGTTGWDAPALAPWLEAAIERASKAAFGASAAYMGEGGSIPFMGMLAEKFPGVQFVVTGVLGPHSNAHGPNEFLHIPTAKKVTAAIAHILADHAAPRG
jgi:acetylornithine deacetylase/succinyl-diaminopimelate desuccinylase-like protein